MHVQIVNFQLKGISEEEYHRGQTEFVREAQADMEQFFASELAEAAKESHRMN